MEVDPAKPALNPQKLLEAAAKRKAEAAAAAAAGAKAD